VCLFFFQFPSKFVPSLYSSSYLSPCLSVQDPKKRNNLNLPHLLFFFSKASHKLSVIHNKNVISGRMVVLAEFEHLNLAQILSTSSLEYLVTIKEPVYPELGYYFYYNMSFQDKLIRSKVLGKDINISIDKFAGLLCLSCEGVDIYILICMLSSIQTMSMLSPPLYYFMIIRTRLWQGMRR